MAIIQKMGGHIYKSQTYRTGTLESELCMGGQIRTDNLPYKNFIPVFGFYMPVTCILHSLCDNVGFGLNGAASQLE